MSETSENPPIGARSIDDESAENAEAAPPLDPSPIKPPAADSPKSGIFDVWVDAETGPQAKTEIDTRPLSTPSFPPWRSESRTGDEPDETPAPRRDSPAIEVEREDDPEALDAEIVNPPSMPSIDWTPHPLPAPTRDDSMPETSGRSRRAAWAPFVLFIAGAIAVIATQRKVGFTWDEAYYHEPARDAALWAIEAIRGDRPPDAAAWIDARWRLRSEHPSVQKFLSGFSLLLFDSTFGPLGSIRFPMALLYGLQLALIFALGRRAWGAGAGLAAALAYFAMPRVFGHAHLATIEPPLLFGILLTVYCYVRGLDSLPWSVACGLSLGLLLATKINGFLLAPPLVLWGWLFARDRCANNFFMMAAIAPLTMIALWPWLWPDPAARLIDYLAFHVEHQKTALWYMGQKWGYDVPDAPWHYPSAILAATTPVTVLALAALGLASALLTAGGRRLPMLFLLIGATMWGVASAPDSPKYDGIRLLLPAMPFVALLAGGGFAAVVLLFEGACTTCRVPRAGASRAASAAALAALSIVAVDGALAIREAHPHFLSYFNPIVGGLAGAEARGFETTYWGEVVNEDVLATLNDETVVPRGSRLYVFALHVKVFHDLQRWGMLRRDLEFNGPTDPERAYDFHLVQMRKGMFGRPEWALVEPTENAPPEVAPVRLWSKDGAPLLALFRTGPAYEAYWRQLPMSFRGSGRSALSPPNP